ncbi:MAG TPA: alpha-ketoglutarate-dependent dioxygenase AlkB [Flavisolibacter sp.]|nr:alpha-ketoglutarate-dependent dioxygenase AlkB [Flavisolibacter sp.]
MQLDIFNDINSKMSIESKVSVVNNCDKVDRVKGLKYISEFISCKEEQDLLFAINSESWLKDLKRRVQHYGWKYDYKVRAIDYSMYLGELPIWIKPFAEKLYKLGLTSKEPDQIIINEYLPGQGIANHVDCEPCFGDTIISISLNSSAIMDFINLKSKEKVEVLLEPRSLVVISGESRHLWSHGIPARKADLIGGYKVDRSLRISLTFRNVIFNT